MRTLLLVPFLPVCMAFVGCGFGPSRDPSAIAAARKDPTPLAHCSVMAQHVEPLVTEWPASSKARLETLLLETLEKHDARAVAVAYAGCEMHIVDACQPPGDYDFFKTTLGRDAIEINDADELYAKLPLGAVGLEAELKRSGKLTVQTVVAGQLKLKAGVFKLEDVHALPGCADATHVIQAVSLGAFQMRAGETTKVAGGISSTFVSGGKSAAHEERLVKEAGNPKACENTLPDQPDKACQSPLQLFLQPIPGSNAQAKAKIFDTPATPAPLPPERVSVGISMRTWSYILGGVGVLAGGAGGLLMLQAKGKADAVNGGTLGTGAEIQSAISAQGTFKGIGIASAALGGAALGVALPFFFMSGGASINLKADVKASAGGSK